VIQESISLKYEPVSEPLHMQARAALPLGVLQFSLQRSTFPDEVELKAFCGTNLVTLHTYSGCNERFVVKDQALHPGKSLPPTILRVGHLWRDKWTALSGPLSKWTALSGPLSDTFENALDQGPDNLQGLDNLQGSDNLQASHDFHLDPRPDSCHALLVFVY